MKLAIAAVVLLVVGVSAQASPLSEAVNSVREGISSLTATSFASPFEVKGRKGSKRVGGRNSAGKGSHYRGGRS